MYVSSLGATTPSICSVPTATIVAAMQRLLNVVLDEAGYQSVPVTGKLDGPTCGAMTLLAGMMKDARCPDTADAQKLLEQCLGIAIPTKPGTAGLGAFGAAAATSALCGAYKNPTLVRAMQRFLNELRTAAGMSRVAETGQWDAATCAALREIGAMKCPSDPAFVASVRACMAGGGTPPNEKSTAAAILVGGGLLAGVAALGYFALKKKGRRAA
jgi:hypothetical protein